MADPRTELVDIIVPAAPEIVATGSHPLLWTAAGMACVAGIAAAVWLWQRRRPARALRRLADAVTSQQDTVPALAARLDAWARVRCRLPEIGERGELLLHSALAQRLGGLVVQRCEHRIYAILLSQRNALPRILQRELQHADQRLLLYALDRPVLA